MKKSFKNLRSRDELSHNQMASIHGGGGTCGYKITYPDGSTSIGCNLSYMQIEIEQDYVDYLKSESEPGTNFKFNWCCDSCAQSTYCN